MKFGIKVGYKDWREKLIKSKIEIPVCEVAYDLTKRDEFKPLYSYLTKKKIYSGIHVPFTVERNWMANLCSKNDELRRNTVRIIKEMIDEAALYKLNYVNFHAGFLIDHQVIDNKIAISSSKTSFPVARKNLLEEVKKLAAYAKKKNVLLTIENPPRFEWTEFDFYNNKVRESFFDVKFFSSEEIYKTLKGKIDFCLDIGHLFTEFCHLEDWFLKMKERLEDFLPYTKLFHFSTVIPPFNGTDSHDGFLDSDFKKGALPSLTETKDLIKLIDTFNPGIPAILEPKPDQMIANYKVLTEIF